MFTNSAGIIVRGSSRSVYKAEGGSGVGLASRNDCLLWFRPRGSIDKEVPLKQDRRNGEQISEPGRYIAGKMNRKVAVSGRGGCRGFVDG